MSTAGDKNKGLTLVEVLVSVVILSVGAVLIMQALGRVSTAWTLGEGRLSATLFLMSKMGEVELALQEGQDLGGHPHGSFQSGDRQFGWDLVYGSVPDDPNSTAVALGVTWKAGQHTFEHRLETILRRPPEESR